MGSRQPAEREAEVLSEQAASRLLTRASELDAANRANTAVAELRAAATEAGISPAAFDAALSELRAGQSAVGEAPRRLSRAWVWIVVLASLLAAFSFFFIQRTVFTVAGTTTAEEATR